MFNDNDTFTKNPSIRVSRSRFDRSSGHKTSFNVGDLIPFYVDEILPGDTVDIDTSKVVRLETLINPVMDNLYLDTYYFFVPNRLVWHHWKEFMGENTSSAWIPNVEYTIPQVSAPAAIPPQGETPGVPAGWQIGTIADYMGIPNGKALEVSALPMRAYALIVNEWFRDQNLQDPVMINMGDSNTAGSNGTNYITDLEKGGMPFVANKLHDYFTSCLPAPQKGPDVSIPVSQGQALPVYATSNFHDPADLTTPAGFFRKVDVPPVIKELVIPTSGTSTTWGTYSTAAGAIPANLWAIDDGTASSATINQLRMAFQLQKLYEKDARGGTRYIELLKSHFGVTSPDARLQRPEYLGGNRVPLTISQVIQSSQTDLTPQGNTAAFSLTTDINRDFTKSFVEHGFVIGVMVARYHHTYQQGIERMWGRKGRFDYYWPVLANIGEQAVKNYEIYAQGNAEDDEVFGYQEAWADYRYKPNRTSAYMRPGDISLDTWHFGDDYETKPILSDEWIAENKLNVDRALAVTSAVSHQLIADIFIRNRTTRPMPLRSIPGLIDHH